MPVSIGQVQAALSVYNNTVDSWNANPAYHAAVELLRNFFNGELVIGDPSRPDDYDDDCEDEAEPDPNPVPDPPVDGGGLQVGAMVAQRLARDRVQAPAGSQVSIGRGQPPAGFVARYVIDIGDGT